VRRKEEIKKREEREEGVVERDERWEIREEGSERGSREERGGEMKKRKSKERREKSKTAGWDCTALHCIVYLPNVAVSVSYERCTCHFNSVCISVFLTECRSVSCDDLTERRRYM
jgi:hypothetical protein